MTVTTDGYETSTDRGKVLSRDGTSANLLASRFKHISLQAEPDLVIHMNDDRDGVRDRWYDFVYM